MKYLTLSADYGDEFLRDDFSGAVDREDLSLPVAIWTELSEWNEAYKAIIPLSQDERSSPQARRRIRELDIEGLRLIASLKAAIEGEVKVAYYSEGLLRSLSDPELRLLQESLRPTEVPPAE